MYREDLQEDLLIPWNEVPMDCGFRVLGATGADKEAQRQRYSKCKAWALQCGLSEDEFQLKLAGVATVPAPLGRAGLAACLRPAPNEQRSRWDHARQDCVDIAIRRAAMDAGGLLGGEQIAQRAAEEVWALMSSTKERKARWASLSNAIEAERIQVGLNLTEHDCRILGYNHGSVFVASSFGCP